MRVSRSKKLLTMRESTRRWMCRLALVCMALLPTLAVFAASMVMMSPWYRWYQRQEWETRISDNLGVTVRTSSFQMTAPQQFFASGVEIRHPETNALLARIDRVDGLMKPHGWSILLDNPVLDGAQLESGLQVLHDWYLCRPQKSTNLLAVGIPKGLQVHSQTGVTHLDRIELLLRPTETSSTIQSKIALADQPFGEISISVTRDHNPETTATSIELSSPKTWIDCDVLSDRIAALKNLGRDAKFRGILHCNMHSSHWDASVSGDISGVDWGTATAALGSPIRSRGSLQLDQLNLRDGKILRAAGEIRCEGGEMHGGWLRRTAELFQLPSQWPSKVEDTLAVDAIGFGFQLDSDGLRLLGGLPGPSAWPPVAATLKDVTLCTTPRTESLQSLVQALQAVPSRDVPTQVVDLNAIYLTSILPWPSAIPKAPEPMQSRLSRHFE